MPQAVAVLFTVTQTTDSLPRGYATIWGYGTN